MEYKQGQTYTEKYLSNDRCINIHGSHTRITKVKETNYGFSIQKFNTYVCLWYIKLTINSDGSAIAKVRQEKNYRPIVNYTVYFDTEGKEICLHGRPVRKELNIYKKLRQC